jgi:hypothetical protein
VGEVVQERGVVALDLELRASVAEGMQDENQFMRFPRRKNVESRKVIRIQVRLKMAGVTSKVSIPFLPLMDF